MRTLGHGPGLLEPLLKKMLEKAIPSRRQNGNIFYDIWRCRRKWQTAFGLRLCGRIRVRALRFQPLSLHGALGFFNVFLTCFGSEKVLPAGVREGRRQRRHPVN